MTFPIIMSFVFGAAFGSFGSVVITRLPKQESIGGRSHCTKCNHILSWYDLIPLVSFMALRGKCHYCHTKLSFRYPLIELATGTTFALIVAKESFLHPALFSTTIIWSYLLILIAFYDSLSQRIPNILLNLLFFFGLLHQSFSTAYASANSLRSGLTGAGLLMGFFGLQWVVSRGRWIGGGDVLLGACIGLFLGASGALITLFIAYILGAIVALYLLATRSATADTHIAFGPFLCLGALLTLLTKDLITQYFLFFG